MKSAAAARRYARALFALAQEDGRVTELRGELEAMAELLAASPELTHSLFRPLHPVAQRRGVMRAVCERLGASAVLRNFYAFLIDQRRIVDFAAIREEFGRLADAAAGRRRAEIVSASPVSDAQRERLQRALGARTGQKVELSFRVDPSLLGGAVARVGGLVFDGSLRTQLRQLRATLTRGQHGHQAR